MHPISPGSDSCFRLLLLDRIDEIDDITLQRTEYTDDTLHGCREASYNARHDVLLRRQRRDFLEVFTREGLAFQIGELEARPVLVLLNKVFQHSRRSDR